MHCGDFEMRRLVRVGRLPVSLGQLSWSFAICSALIWLRDSSDATQLRLGGRFFAPLRPRETFVRSA